MRALVVLLEEGRDVHPFCVAVSLAGGDCSAPVGGGIGRGGLVDAFVTVLKRSLLPDAAALLVGTATSG